MTTAIQKPPTRKLTKKQAKALASFTDPATILVALADEEWTVQKAIQHLVDIAKGSREVEEDGNKIEKEVKTTTQLAAIKYLNQLIIDAMERSGLMVLATKKFVGEDGEEVRLSGHMVSSILRGQKEQTTPEELVTNIITEENENGQDSSKRKDEEDGRKSGLETSKPPTGKETDCGHFDGISKSGDYDTEDTSSIDLL